MKLEAKDVLHVAKLARIGMEEQEAQTFSEELSGILDYVDQLSEVDTTGVEETASVSGNDTVLRSDEVTCEDKREELLAMSQKTKRGGQILVDNIL